MTDAYPGRLPTPTPDTRPFWDAARDGRLSLPKCNACGGWTYYPRPFCMHCFSEDITWTEASGTGTIYSYTINHMPVPSYDGPVAIVVVALDEGPRMIATLNTDGPPNPDRIALDAPVRIGFRRVTEDIALPYFDLACFDLVEGA